MMDFGSALAVLKAGGRAKREMWKNVRWIALQRPDEHSKMTLPYIYTETIDGGLVPWLASQTDILAEDWVEVSIASPPTRSGGGAPHAG